MEVVRQRKIIPPIKGTWPEKEIRKSNGIEKLSNNGRYSRKFEKTSRRYMYPALTMIGGTTTYQKTVSAPLTRLLDEDRVVEDTT
jgi:hypothetical protein